MEETTRTDGIGIGIDIGFPPILIPIPNPIPSSTLRRSRNLRHEPSRIETPRKKATGPPRRRRRFSPQHHEAAGVEAVGSGIRWDANRSTS
jgi:hypothetical protein